jgi:hypothetical protein
MLLSPLITCFLGYDSNICYLPDNTCENYRFCQQTAAAWPLPFYWDENNSALVISFSRASIRECWNPTIIYHTIDGGALVDSNVLGGFSSELCEGYYEPFSFRKFIKLIWEQLGWMAAVINPNFPHEVNPDYDPIPF